QDDATPTRADHRGEGRLGDEDRPQQIDINRRPDLARCERSVLSVPLRRPNRMTREARRDVETAERFHDVGDKTLTRSGVRDVRLEGDPSRTEFLDRADGRLGGLLPVVVLHPDIGALSREFEDRGATDASAAPGDQGDTPIESTHGDPTRSARNKCSGHAPPRTGKREGTQTQIPANASGSPAWAA